MLVGIIGDRNSINAVFLRTHISVNISELFGILDAMTKDHPCSFQHIFLHDQAERLKRQIISESK